MQTSSFLFKAAEILGLGCLFNLWGEIMKHKHKKKKRFTFKDYERMMKDNKGVDERKC